MADERHKVIDCAVIRDDGPGTVVRLYLGDAGLASWWGDDWDDAPYEHNAGTVYPEYVSSTADIEFPAGYVVWEPCDDPLHLGNSPWSNKRRCSYCCG